MDNPEKNPLHIFHEGVRCIMEEPGLKDDVWSQFFLGYIVG